MTLKGRWAPFKITFKHWKILRHDYRHFSTPWRLKIILCLKILNDRSLFRLFCHGMLQTSNADENALAFNFLDRLLLEMIKHGIPDTNEMSHSKRSCIRMQQNRNGEAVPCSFNFLTSWQVNNLPADRG